MKDRVRNAFLVLALSIGFPTGSTAFAMDADQRSASGTAQLSAGEIERRRTKLRTQSAGASASRLRADVIELAKLAKAHVADVGPSQAVRDFADREWTRLANGLHLWGVTMTGESWFDMGHPELVGTNASAMSDIEGRYWARLARESAEGTGKAVFSLVFPHPRTRQSATGYHTCFLMPDRIRILCAGAFEDKNG